LGDNTRMGIVADKAAERVASRIEPGLPKWLMPAFGGLILAGILGLIGMYAGLASLTTDVKNVHKMIEKNEVTRKEDDARFRETMKEIQQRLRELERGQ